MQRSSGIDKIVYQSLSSAGDDIHLLTPAQAGRPRRVAAGETVLVQVPGAGEDGKWTVVKAPGLTPTGKDVLRALGPSGGETITYGFSVPEAAAGTTIQLTLARKSNKGAAPQSLVFHLEVTARRGPHFGV